MTSFISGEKFQELADVSIALNIDSNYKSNIVKDQLANIQTKCFVFEDEAPIVVPDEIKNAKTIFVYTHILNFFFTNIFPQIEQPITLITHNSDDGVDSDHLQYIDSDKIKKWYCQNRYINHPKLISLPIGIANSQWPHGNQELLHKIANENIQKTNLVFKNFDIGTNYNSRTICNNVTNANNIHMSPHTTNENYWKQISASNYVIAPHGNGVDSHRIWESLILKTIPVVQYHECFSQFTDLPILFVNDWGCVTHEYLQSNLSKLQIKMQNLDMLQMLHWKNKIHL